MENYNRRTGVSNLVSNWNRVQPTIVAETTTNGTTWTSLAPTQDGDYNVLTFTDTRTTENRDDIDGRFQVKNGPLLIEYLVVGGGGVGGSTGATDSGGGGGGGGGVDTGFLYLEPNVMYEVRVGSGGTGTGVTTRDGGESYIRASTTDYRAYAMGGGCGEFVGGSPAAGNGGSGGGSCSVSTAWGSSTASGFMGSRGAGSNSNQSAGNGGGGATGFSPGGIQANGGPGFTSTISGSSVVYGAGGGGGAVGNSPAGTASSGAGAGGSNSNGSSGIDGQGGGGGGGGRDTLGPYVGGNGGDGVVIIRWRARGTDVNGVSQRDIVSDWQAVPGTIIGETTTDGTNWTQLAPSRVGNDYLLTFQNTRGFVTLKLPSGRFTVVNRPVWIWFLVVGGGGAGGKSGTGDSGGGGGAAGGVIERRFLVEPGTYNVCVGFRGRNGSIVNGPIGTLIEPVAPASFGPAGPQATMPLYGYAAEGQTGRDEGAAAGSGQGSSGGMGSGGGAQTSTGTNGGLLPKSFFWTPGGTSTNNAFGGGGGGGASALSSSLGATSAVTRSTLSPSSGNASSTAGGPGIAGYSSDITGTTVVYGSGGGGGGDGLGAGGTAGTGGGNGGSNSAGSNATTAGSGGGGGGRDTLGPYNGGDGANGIVIIRWSVV